MRTTLNLDDDVMRAIRALAQERGLSLGDVVSELPHPARRMKNGNTNTIPLDMATPGKKARTGTPKGQPTGEGIPHDYPGRRRTTRIRP